MRPLRGFTLVELLVVIMILGTLMAMAVPRLGIVQERGRQAAMKMNLHKVQVVIELFHTEQGYYAYDFYEDEYGAYFPGGVLDQQIGRLPTNPWTGKQMDPDEFNVEDYDSEHDCSNTLEDGPNDLFGYYPGEIVYSVYDPPTSMTPVNYGLVGIERHGLSMREFDADGEVVIFVLHN